MEVVKRLHELFCQKGFILVESVLLRAESNGLNVLDFKFDHLAWNCWNADIEMGFHIFIKI